MLQIHWKGTEFTYTDSNASFARNPCNDTDLSRNTDVQRFQHLPMPSYMRAQGATHKHV